MRFRGQLADQPATLPRGQARVSCLPDQLIPEQRDLLRARRPLAVFLSP
jgi:hypothetical protein